MKGPGNHFGAWMLASIVLWTGAPVLAQEQAAPAAPAAPVFKPEELEQIVAPIALYPDSLLAQVLMASTYPLEVVEAARWAKANPDIKGEAVLEGAGEADLGPEREVAGRSSRRC